MAKPITTSTPCSDITTIEGFELDPQAPRQGAVFAHWYVRGAVRVVLGGDDGVDVFVFTNRTRTVLESQAQFSGSTPAYAVLKFIDFLVSP